MVGWEGTAPSLQWYTSGGDGRRVPGGEWSQIDCTARAPGGDTVSTTRHPVKLSPPALGPQAPPLALLLAAGSRCVLMSATSAQHTQR